MKRIVVILLILLLVGGLAGCGGTSDLVGTWDIEGEFGSLSFTFNEDGTGVEFWENSRDTFNWSASSGNITFEFEDGHTEVIAYSIDGDTLTLTEDGEELVFTRS